MQRRAVTPFPSLAGALTLLAVFAAGCGGATSTLPRSAGAAATPSPSPVPLPGSATATVTVGASTASASLGPVLGGYSGIVTLPAASNAAALTLTLSGAQPAGTPAVQSMKRRPQTIGGTGIAPVAYLTITSSALVSFDATPLIAITLPAGTPSLGQIAYIALYDSTASPQPGWTMFEGPATASGTTLTFAGSNAGLQLKAGVAYDLVVFSVIGTLPTPTPTPTPTPSPTPVPTATPIPVRGTITEFPIPQTGHSPAVPNGITTGPDGDLWFTTDTRVGKMTTSGTVTEYTLPITSHPARGIVSGPDGNLWFPEEGYIAKFTTSGTLTEYPLSTSGFVAGIAVGGDGNLWFGLNNPGSTSWHTWIGTMTTSGAFAQYEIAKGANVTVTDIAASADGNLWFLQDNGYIGRITTSGIAANFGDPYTPRLGGIAPGPGGMWFTGNSIDSIFANDYVGLIDASGHVTQYLMPPSTGSQGIVAGPDGNLWVVERNSHHIGRVTTAGVLTEYPLPQGSTAYWITQGSDRNLWYSATGTIGRIVP